MAGSNILTRKQLEKMPNNQLIDFAMSRVSKELITKINLNTDQNLSSKYPMPSK